MAEETRDVTLQIVSITFDTDIIGQSKTYTGTEVIYKDSKGEVKKKGMASTVFKYNPTLKTDLAALKSGDYALVVMVKKGEFVNWVSAKKVDAPAAQHEPVKEEPKQQTAAHEFDKDTPTVGGNVKVTHALIERTPTKEAVRSNYETPEERAKRQVMIVRQSSITAALKLFELGGSGGGGFVPDEAQVITSAKIFEAYVLGEKHPDGGFIDSGKKFAPSEFSRNTTEPLLPE